MIEIAIGVFIGYLIRVERERYLRLHARPAATSVLERGVGGFTAGRRRG